MECGLDQLSYFSRVEEAFHGVFIFARPYAVVARRPAGFTRKFTRRLLRCEIGFTPNRRGFWHSLLGPSRGNVQTCLLPGIALLSLLRRAGTSVVLDGVRREVSSREMSMLSSGDSPKSRRRARHLASYDYDLCCLSHSAMNVTAVRLSS